MDLGDPDPPPVDAAKTERAHYKQAVYDYSESMLTCFEEAGLKDEELWMEFTCTFRAQTIKELSPQQHLTWIRFLRKNGVYVKQKRGYARWKALLDCLTSAEFVATKQSGTSTPVPVSSIDNGGRIGNNYGNRGIGENRIGLESAGPEPIMPSTLGQSNAHMSHKRQSDEYVTRSRDAEREGKNDQRRILIHSSEDIRESRTVTVPKDRGDSDSRYDKPKRSTDQVYRDQTYTESGGSGFHKKISVESLMKAYSNREKFSGSFTEDFDGAVQQFQTLAVICDASEEDMAKAFPIMLTGSAFHHYTRRYSKRSLTFQSLVDEFRAWYTSEEQRYRLLQTWQRQSLLRAMQHAPEKSEIEVFREVSDELTKVQHQLHSSYHDDRFLRDQLLVAADIPHVRRSLIDKIPRTAQEAMQRIAAILSSEPRSAGANYNDDEILYGLGKRFGGKAKRTLKGSNARRGKGNLRKLLASVKGCWVCGKDHLANGNNSPKEIMDALERIKKKNPDTLCATELEDIQYVFSALDLGGSGEDDSSSDSDSDEGINFLDLNEDQMKEQESQIMLANSAFIHGRTFVTDSERDMKQMNVALAAGEEIVFKGIILDTGANRKSAMSIEQYKAYCREFQVPMSIDYEDNRGHVGIGGTTNAVGTATILIPFIDLDLVIDVKFRILRTKCPSLLSLRDMITNGLDISIQDKVVTYKHKIQPVLFENDFLVHRWNPNDTSYILYSEKELRRLHRVFGHPTVTALTKLLKKANPSECTADVKSAIEQITKECNTCTRFSSRPRRFKITMGSDDLRFNHVLAADVMYLEGKAVLHVVDEATHYTAATFLQTNSAEDTWKALQRCWTRVYLGPPDHLRVDQGSNFVSRHFKDSAEADGVVLLEAPVESPSTMSHVERYQAPLRAAYKKIRDSLPKSDTDRDCLQLAVKSVNDTIGPEGLCPTLLDILHMELYQNHRVGR